MLAMMLRWSDSEGKSMNCNWGLRLFMQRLQWNNNIKIYHHVRNGNKLENKLSHDLIIACSLNISNGILFACLIHTVSAVHFWMCRKAPAIQFCVTTYRWIILQAHVAVGCSGPLMVLKSLRCLPPVLAVWLLVVESQEYPLQDTCWVLDLVMWKFSKPVTGSVVG